MLCVFILFAFVCFVSNLTVPFDCLFLFASSVFLPFIYLLDVINIYVVIFILKINVKYC